MSDDKKSLSKVNGDQVLRYAHDPISKALRITPSEEMSFSIELDANDGDSVTIHRLHRQANIDEEMDARGLCSVTAYNKSGHHLNVQVSPDLQGDDWYTVGSFSSKMLDVEICASRVRLTGGSDGKLVGRS